MLKGLSNRFKGKQSKDERKKKRGSSFPFYAKCQMSNKLGNYT